MEQNEDVGTGEVVIEQQTEEQPIVADIIDTPQNDEITISESEIDTILTDVLNNIPTEPIFPEKKEEIEIETKTNEDFLTDEELEELDNTISDLENSITENKKIIEKKDIAISELNSNIKEINSTLSIKDKEISTIKKDLTLLEEGLTKISNHPIIGPLATKIVLGEDLDIPEYLNNSINEELNAIPNFGNIQNTGLPQTKTKSVHDKLKEVARQTY